MDFTTFDRQVVGYTASNTPFLFIVDFECRQPFVCPLHEAAEAGFLFDIKGRSNTSAQPIDTRHPKIDFQPVDRRKYAEAFQTVKNNIAIGNTYLLNLTFPSRIDANVSLADLFRIAQAPYKLYRDDEFVVFSPECFVQIRDDFIYTYPMKGTIDAKLPNAETTLLHNLKEMREHNTIVDLLRNDLATVAEEVSVTKFRYVESIKTHRSEILQTSSEIRGKLPKDWKQNLGTILLKLLPAGSVTGAPKDKTVEIIKAAEITPRNFYTGVFGIYDGQTLDSAVAIRFIEKKDGELWYRSGGGITFMSDEQDEYQELIDKIYVPTL